MTWLGALLANNPGVVLAALWGALTLETLLLWRIGKAKLQRIDEELEKMRTSHNDKCKADILLGAELNRLTMAVEKMDVTVTQHKADDARAHDEIKEDISENGQRIARLEGKIGNGGTFTRHPSEGKS